MGLLIIFIAFFVSWKLSYFSFYTLMFLYLITMVLKILGIIPHSSTVRYLEQYEEKVSLVFYILLIVGIIPFNSLVIKLIFFIFNAICK